MAYGDYNGPDKPDKGLEGGSCNRRRCQASPALWFNHGSRAWYCGLCRHQIEFDPVNKFEWNEYWRPKVGHPMFETRRMMETRQTEDSSHG